MDKYLTLRIAIMDILFLSKKNTLKKEKMMHL